MRISAASERLTFLWEEVGDVPLMIWDQTWYAEPSIEVRTLEKVKWDAITDRTGLVDTDGGEIIVVEFA